MSSVGQKNKYKEPASIMDRDEDDDDDDDGDSDDSEMDRNFSLLSQKRSTAVTVEDVEEDSDDEEVVEEEEEVVTVEDVEEDGDEEEVVEEAYGEEEGAPGSEEEEQPGPEEDADSSEEEEEDDDDEDDDDDDDDDDDEPRSAGVRARGQQSENDIKKELSTMSFEDIVKLQNKVGTKVFNEIAYGTNDTPTSTARKRIKRLNKNRPKEISSKRRTRFLRQVVPVKKALFRDPRFDDLSGEYKPEIFEKTYKFINDIRLREKVDVKQLLKKSKDSEKREKLKALLKRMDNQDKARKREEKQREKDLEFKKRQREMAEQGLQPFYLKKSDKKKLELADKYNELKKSGKLENFLGKKRKRNATKDRRKLPPKQH